MDEVHRPDGSIGYRPKGQLKQYDDMPQGPPRLEHQPAVDGTVVRNLHGIAYNEKPDGIFDSITLAVTEEPAPVPTLATPPSSPEQAQTTETDVTPNPET